MTEAMRTEEMRAWLYDRALPFWAEAGIDSSGAGAWEALEHDGTPQRTRNKRLRVMPRQAFVFASAGGAYLPLARRLFDFAMARGFDPNTGHLAALLSPEGEILKAPHDLYDMAFMLLASAALTEAGEDVAADLAALTEKLGWLKAERGWYETSEGAAKHPRRQNPHMHLFEASTELYRVTGDAAWRAIADECLSLFKEVFLQGDGRVFEFFNLDWSAAESQAVEPGHMAEWIWLLHRYEVATGESAGVDLNAVWAATLKGQDASGLLYDSSEPLSETRRLWPQTELLKASLVVGGTGDMAPERVASRLYAEYLDTEVPGGWYDKRRISDGALISTDMPSSTFYHLYVAAVAFIDRAA